MFFKKRNDMMFRKYQSFGYITDNRNFGYKKVKDYTNPSGDKILSESGVVFFSALDMKPQSIDELAEKIKEQFVDADYNTIKNDSEEFYSMLESDGFIISGTTRQECEEKEYVFSYREQEKEIVKSQTTSALQKRTHTQDFFEKYLNGKPQLTSLHIEITSKCNERCIHCYIPHENKTHTIDNDLFYKILDQCNEMKVLHLTLSGGEPMLHKSFCDFLKKCKEYNFSVNILSNLTLLNDEILDEIRKNPLIGVQVSLYSMNPDIHDDITKKKGSFEKTKKSILKLIENNIPLQISCPILQQNKDCYIDVIRWAEKYNIHAGDDYVIIARHDHITDNLSCRLSIDEVQQIITNKISSNGEYLRKLKADAFEKKDISPDEFICSVCSSSVCITENGNVYPCAGWQGYILGNLNTTTLNEIWTSSEKAQYLRNLRRHDFPKCIQCTDKEFCTMCMVRNANEDKYGNPLAINEYFCRTAKLKKSLALNAK